MKTALISGATGGIGHAIAMQLYADGFNLSLGVRNIEKAKIMFAEFDPTRLQLVTYDALNTSDATKWVQNAYEKFAQIDVLINCAGFLAATNIENFDEAILDRVWAINAKAPVCLTHAAFPYLKACGNGRIINIISLSGKRVKGKSFAYGMAKHAMMAFTHSLRHTGWEYGIRSTAIMPGWVNTDMIKTLCPFPLDQVTQPREIAKLVSVIIQLPNTASVPEIPINCQLEDTV